MQKTKSVKILSTIFNWIGNVQYRKLYPKLEKSIRSFRFAPMLECQTNFEFKLTVSKVYNLCKATVPVSRPSGAKINSQYVYANCFNSRNAFCQCLCALKSKTLNNRNLDICCNGCCNLLLTNKRYFTVKFSD